MTPTDNIRKLSKKPARKATVKSSSQSAPAPTSADADGVNDPVDEQGGRVEGAAFPIVGVGASAGGLEAFQQLLGALPADTGMAFVLVQHLAPAHASALAEILSRATSMPVMEAQDRSPVVPNHIYVIPPGQCMALAEGALQLAPRESVGHHRVIDHFFRALAVELNHQAIGVVLSGTASDGTAGLEAIKAQGGITFAQDDTAQHDGMPHSAIASGCVDFVLPPDAIAREIARIGRHPHGAPEASSREADDAPKLTDVLQMLRHATGVDFTDYKFNTLYRRITRRMVLRKMDVLSDYVGFLRQNPAEIEALYQDVLIGVTSFFRDPASFAALADKVFPRLIKDRSPYDPVRVWTLGCSTGQEAYSLAIAFTEFAERQGSAAPLQIFATDLNATGVDQARAGVYSKEITKEVSPERLRRFFVESGGGYRISKAIRDACVFSRHNVLTDPPFSRIDLISCRNLLIYLEPVLQQKIVPTLHYALKPDGYLWLGGAETIGGYRTLFEARDAKHKIYVKRSGSVAAAGNLALQRANAPRPPFVPITARATDGGTQLHREADRILLTKFTPPGVLVSADLDILQYRGDTGAYLTPAPGKASLSLLKMLREGLLVAVRAAVLRAERGEGPVREEGLRVRSNGSFRDVAIEVIPVKAEGATRGGFLILFDDATRTHTTHSASVTAPQEPPATDDEYARMTRELTETREYLQSVIEHQEAANEELQSASEEVQSANEELQSTNEELETSKEEIQSSNEELATVNDELNNRNTELTRLNDDLVNVFDSAQIAIVILGSDLRVRRFTKASEQLLSLDDRDLGRPLGAIKLNVDVPDLEALAAQVMDTATATEREVRNAQGRWFSLSLRPYRAADGGVDGVILTLADVDVLKRAEAYTASIVATVREPLLVLDNQLQVRTANRAFYAAFQTTPAETEGRLLYQLGDGAWDIPDLRRLLEDVLPQDHQVTDFAVEHEFANLGKRTILLNARRLVQAIDESPLILLAFLDITEPKQARLALRQSEERFRMMADNIAQFAWMADARGYIFWYNQRWYEYTGTTLDEMKGWGWRSVHHPDHVERVVKRLQRSWDTGDLWEDTFPLRGKDGNYRWFLSRALPIRDAAGDIVRWFGTNTDITEQRQMASELRQNADDLLDADRRKNEFLAMLAHELRNPLAPIRNALETLRLAKGNRDAEQAATQMMERQVDQLVRLVDDLLDVSRISRGKIVLGRKTVELASVVHLAAEAARPGFELMGHRLTVTVPANVYVDGDPTRLAQVFGNLLNNACKFTDRGGHVSLDVAREDNEAVIRVRDNGIGIDADEQARIFEMFTQVDTSLERSSGGLGIGLTLVKTLVQLHDGTVEVHSAGVGQGSEFVVRLPMVAASGIPSQEPSLRSPAPTPVRRILVVDDNVDAARSLAQLLESSGHETHIANDGLEAVAAAATFRPHVVLLDIGLPKLNGYAAARKIREQPWSRDMLLVALTGWGQEDDRRKSSEAGFNMHLVKPVEPAALLRLLSESPPGHLLR